ncbi:dipeptide/oligopeptide/nickel ABC transporter ATP-binding protein [Ammoniphilus oxalaticus]|uniref:Dipeptide/oligopeptide/nickel ABC transporter ATP-binding protein n=1 Tax=Ammoniphilus oxalaticus TaxID=66863 RepID=A0A419SEL0_9BACL|nr:oligopeptide/dipeptide ABC transporter ATP-binding protein [Ammoniphilus oxalaticus]RKD21697.1 dipeptide/oligopeptide/nickel ABC transporter ATP-binding protein [Ammoniphilus oxalaticus]
MYSDELLAVEGLKVRFPIKRRGFSRERQFVKAVDDLSFRIRRGVTFGLVGESGCGKSTTGRAILRLIEPTAGQILFEGTDITKLSKEQWNKTRKEMQMVFQDPYASLNPRHTIERIIEEPLKVHQVENVVERAQRVRQLLEVVGLDHYHAKRYPHQFSGGQRQRIGIARALAARPKLVIADEPVSALDVSIQSQIINLLRDLQQSFELTYLFISHDLSVVKHICDQIGVMYAGRLVEVAGKNDLYKQPLHPYTRALLAAAPIPDPERSKERIFLREEAADVAMREQGCPFYHRCPSAFDRCIGERPALDLVAPNHTVACHLYT